MKAATRTARLGLRTTPQQESVLRRAAEVSHKSMTDFILDSACQAAEQTLLDQRVFVMSGQQAHALRLKAPLEDGAGALVVRQRDAQRQCFPAHAILVCWLAMRHASG